MELDSLILVIGFAGTIIASVLGLKNTARTARKDSESVAASNAQQESDIRYIKSGIDEIRNDIKCTTGRVDGLTERVIRVEESSKQAHKRIDEHLTKNYDGGLGK